MNFLGIIIEEVSTRCQDVKYVIPITRPPLKDIHKKN